MLVGIDIGTTHVKVGAFEPNGHLVASAARPTPTLRLGPELAEHDALELWSAVRACLSEVLSGLPASAVTSVGVSSFGESGVALDADGNPVAPVLAWYDARTAELYGEWAATANGEAVRRLTGLAPDPTYGMFKLAWFARQRPAEAARTVTWLSVADWIAFRLTGRAQIGASQAARTLALDLRSLDWSAAQLASVGIGAEWLPAVRSAGTPVGRVTEGASRETGLPEGAVVGDTGHDQVMAALGAGGAAGTIVNSCGTAETLMAFVTRGALEEALELPDVAVGPHALPGVYYLMATVRAAGSVVDWAVRTFACGNETTPSVAIPDAAYEAAREAAAAAGVGAHGVWFVPHLRASPQASRLPSLSGGHYGGIRETTGSGDMLRAVLEGLSFESFRHLRPLVTVGSGNGPVEVVAVGGPTRDALWMQIKADVFGAPVTVREPSEGALWGAALAGRLGAGALPATSAEPRAAGPGRRYLPSRDAALYRRLALRYADRVARLAEVAGAGEEA